MFGSFANLLNIDGSDLAPARKQAYSVLGVLGQWFVGVSRSISAWTRDLQASWKVTPSMFCRISIRLAAHQSAARYLYLVGL